MTDKALKRIILEMGTGNDLHGGDYTKAAKRAVQDALHHSSLVLFRSLEIDPNDMEIELTLAAQEPDKVDVATRAVKGRLNVPDDATGGYSVVVNAGILVRLSV
ncbi:MAG: Lin0512 family protein [Geminicoccaceae bacterium]